MRWTREIAFKIAGSMAFKDAMKNASPVLLEPIMSVEVHMPDEVGRCVGNLNPRRGRSRHGNARSAQVISSGAAVGDVWLCDGFAEPDAGRGIVYDAVFTLQGSAESIAEKIIGARNQSVILNGRINEAVCNTNN